MIRLENVSKRFDEHGRWILDDVSLTIPTGQMTCILGRSGEGKSVLLKQIIGLIKPTAGSIYVDSLCVSNLSPEDERLLFKKCGYVFQFAALLDSLTIYENIALALFNSDIPQDDVKERVMESIKLVNLPADVLGKFPNEVSGGMRKRAGLARTLMTRPEIILYDEPTTGLDPITTRVVHELMYTMQKNLNITSVVISHDISILDYTDNVALLHQGKIRFFGTAKDMWSSSNEYINQFIKGSLQGPIQP